MEYPLAPTHARIREIWQMTTTRSGVAPGKVQKGTILAFASLNNLSRNLSVNLQSNDDQKITPLQMLLPNMRIAEMFALGLGICRVPVKDGVELFGNAEFSSDPYDTMFTAVEQVALRHLFLATLAFKTNTTDRFDALHTSEFLIKSVSTSDKTIKPVMLPASYTMVGGEPNVLSLAMPSSGDLLPLNDSAARKLYLCFNSQVMIVVPPSESQKQSIAAQMRGE
ncbi:MAG: hypothetical protein U5L45_15870 [Saprospiraceae bacterium]|nr:hypothetical protein [Saprospiraceae bacterium]